MNKVKSGALKILAWILGLSGSVLAVYLPIFILLDLVELFAPALKETQVVRVLRSVKDLLFPFALPALLMMALQLLIWLLHPRYTKAVLSCLLTTFSPPILIQSLFQLLGQLAAFLRYRFRPPAPASYRQKTRYTLPFETGRPTAAMAGAWRTTTPSGPPSWPRRMGSWWWWRTGIGTARGRR